VKGKQKLDLQAKIKDFLKTKNCVGSINYYQERLKGTFLMANEVYDELDAFSQENMSEFTIRKITGESYIEKDVKDNWGRCENFILFD
jgi:hypothetical protein